MTITSVEPSVLEGDFAPGDTVTIYGKNLDLLPEETCICYSDNDENAQHYQTVTLGYMEAMPIFERDKNHITFTRTAPSTAHLAHPYYPYYLVTPYEKPREIVLSLK